MEPYGKYENPLIKVIKDSIFKPTGVYWIEFDPSTKNIEMKMVADGFFMANGIVFDKEKKHVWIADSLAKTVSKYERNMTTNELTKHNEVETGYVIDNLKYCHLNDRLYTGGIATLHKHTKAMDPPSKARDHHPENYSVMQELGIPEFGMGIKRDLVVTDKMGGMSNALRVGHHLVGGSPLADGVLICYIDEETPAMVAQSIDFEVHKHMEL